MTGTHKMLILIEQRYASSIWFRNPYCVYTAWKSISFVINVQNLDLIMVDPLFRLKKSAAP